MQKLAPDKDTARPESKQIQFLENKINRLRWMNDDLNKQVFTANQRGHRLAAKLGYQDLSQAEAALATQVGVDASETQQSQLEQLSQYPSEELASHVQELQSELTSHIQLSKSTLSALGDALNAITELRGENEKFREELAKASASVAGKLEVQVGQGVQKAEDDDSSGARLSSFDTGELAYVLAEHAALKAKYAALHKAKQVADDKHAEDYKRWKEFKQWLDAEIQKAERDESAAKRRKLNHPEDKDEKGSIAAKGGRKTKHKRLQGRVASNPRFRSEVSSRIPTLGPFPPAVEPAVLTSRDLNSSSSASSSGNAFPSKSGGVPPVPLEHVKQNSPMVVSKEKENTPSSSDTEPDSQPIAYLYPSQLDVAGLSSPAPSTIPQKRPCSPVQDRGSSETEVESQVATFLYPSQITPLTPAQVAEKTAKPDPPAQQAQQLQTPMSIARPLAGKLKRKHAISAQMPPPSSPTLSDPFGPSSRSAVDTKPRLPETPMSRPSKKGKERATENDENVPASSDVSTAGKRHPTDYSMYKGRGRYGPEAQAGKETINALFEVDPERNGGVGFQFEEVVRDREKRKQLHGGDCECCRDYYEAVGPLPARLQPPMWRSPESSPSKKPARISFGDDNEDASSSFAIEEHKNAISRHRQGWERPKTPPGYWNIGFPTTQEVDAMNAEAARMHERKRAMVAEEAERGGKYRKR
ncbi:DNA repair protein endonuclease SAE2/CtIP C-terminus-domain-containing protein [Dichomitus squalens]|uniref:DNA repair protein endonuclease SAE2/CtIP C-terminus-domain-containing protein n=1 Tax=Dichomitus squalens TaxID=114155 RepID=A0A4Q9Q7N7_9APHY|nr:DNA repair protein endonuclease SAE2/CtIP C-terminus-domain-containing protein [Dichomitus squalens]TBU63435.1 DNA repair protein endonuclease SAE2/CtIP C-terminus-domain-containing protein [Dichomitus squalens]